MVSERSCLVLESSQGNFNVDSLSILSGNESQLSLNSLGAVEFGDVPIKRGMLVQVSLWGGEALSIIASTEGKRWRIRNLLHSNRVIVNSSSILGVFNGLGSSQRKKRSSDNSRELHFDFWFGGVCVINEWSVLVGINVVVKRATEKGERMSEGCGYMVTLKKCAQTTATTAFLIGTTQHEGRCHNADNGQPIHPGRTYSKGT